MRLLLVEDDIMIGESIEEALRADGLLVDWFRDGVSAEGALLATRHEIVLLDLGLPRKDGVAVLRSMRARKDRTPVVIVTARDQLEDRVAGLNAGADDYGLKPFEMDELPARIQAVLRRSAGHPEAMFEHGPVRVGATVGLAKAASGGLSVHVRFPGPGSSIAGHALAPPG